VSIILAAGLVWLSSRSRYVVWSYPVSVDGVGLRYKVSRR
jgi:hypothetical protein